MAKNKCELTLDTFCQAEMMEWIVFKNGGYFVETTFRQRRVASPAERKARIKAKENMLVYYRGHALPKQGAVWTPQCKELKEPANYVSPQ